MFHMNAKFFATEYFYYGFFFFKDEVSFGLSGTTHEVQ
jgi:hypothetical protein